MIYWEYHPTAAKPTNYTCNQYWVPCSLADNDGNCKIGECTYTASHSETYHNPDIVARSFTINKDLSDDDGF